MSAVPAHPPRQRMLDAIERLGNALPDPVALFVLLIAVLAAVSALGAASGWTATHPVTGATLAVHSLLEESAVRRALVELPAIYAGFPVLGMVLLVMLGAGVAERSGLFHAVVATALRDLSPRLLVPAVLLLGMLSTQSGDTGYLVYVPLAGMAFAAAGRDPVLGIAVGFAGVGVGLSGNLLPGQYDVMMLGITQSAAHLLDPTWRMNPLANWWFSAAVAVAFTLAGWLVAERIVAPRLAASPVAAPVLADASAEASAATMKRGLRAAALAALAVVALFAVLALAPGYAPLQDRAAGAAERWVPFFDSLVAGFFLLFLACGWAYGRAVGTIRSHRDVVTMMGAGVASLAPWLVVVFFAALFVAMFRWSNLGPITAILGAEQLRALDVAPALLVPALTTASSGLDLLISSGSAKWTAMAPVATPMLMLLGVSPDMATAAYRLGDTVTNLVSPLNPYFVLTLAHCRRWYPDFRLGTLLAVMLPFSLAFYVVGVVLTGAWVALELPVGPGAPATYRLPGSAP